MDKMHDMADKFFAAAASLDRCAESFASLVE
jgi:hypothetical protein